MKKAKKTDAERDNDQEAANHYCRSTVVMPVGDSDMEEYHLRFMAFLAGCRHKEKELRERIEFLERERDNTIAGYCLTPKALRDAKIAAERRGAELALSYDRDDQIQAVSESRIEFAVEDYRKELDGDE